ncbi:MAG: sulfatase [Proteobacteria bacterium]|nr:sulfatase [Pseudomonadota bacterium]
MLLLSLFLGCSCSTEPEPDVVLVIVDTLRADAMGFAGSDFDSTPNLDTLVETEAAWFDRAYSSSSWTLASTTTLLTGQPSWEHRVIRSATNTACFGRLPDHVPTLPSVWRGRGYRTGAWINNGFLAPAFGLNGSFDVYDYEGAAPIGHRTAQETVDLALAWLDEDDGPAFMLVHIMEPHANYAPEAPFAGTFTKGLPHDVEVPFADNIHYGLMSGMLPPPPAEDIQYIRAAYHEEVLQSDAAIQSLVDGLKSRGRWDDTTFVLTSDHGEEFWEQGRYEHGHTLRSPVTHVPLIVKAPGVVPGKKESIVPAVAVSQMLWDNGGQLMDQARGVAGALGADFAVMDDILYGPESLSIVTRSERLVLHPATKTANLWELGPDGIESAQADDDVQNRVATLQESLYQTRGSFDAPVPLNPLAISDPSLFQMLRELGYVDADATPGTPCQ